jgi:hypothetical protein
VARFVVGGVQLHTPRLRYTGCQGRQPRARQAFPPNAEQPAWSGRRKTLEPAMDSARVWRHDRSYRCPRLARPGHGAAVMDRSASPQAFDLPPDIRFRGGRGARQPNGGHLRGVWRRRASVNLTRGPARCGNRRDPARPCRVRHVGHATHVKVSQAVANCRVLHVPRPPRDPEWRAPPSGADSIRRPAEPTRCYGPAPNSAGRHRVAATSAPLKFCDILWSADSPALELNASSTVA